MNPTLTYDSDTDILTVACDEKTKFQLTGEAMRTLKEVHNLDAAAEFVSIFRTEATEMTDDQACQLYAQLTQHINENYPD